MRKMKKKTVELLIAQTLNRSHNFIIEKDPLYLFIAQQTHDLGCAIIIAIEVKKNTMRYE